MVIDYHRRPPVGCPGDGPTDSPAAVVDEVEERDVGRHHREQDGGHVELIQCHIVDLPRDPFL